MPYKIFVLHALQLPLQHRHTSEVTEVHGFPTHNPAREMTHTPILRRLLVRFHDSHLLSRVAHLLEAADQGRVIAVHVIL